MRSTRSAGPIRRCSRAASTASPISTIRCCCPRSRRSTSTRWERSRRGSCTCSSCSSSWPRSRRAARWLVTDERWSLAVATLCFAGALLLKNEGTLFVAAAFAGLLAAAYRRWRPLAVAAAIDVLLLLPWKLYVRVHDLHDINYSLG